MFNRFPLVLGTVAILGVASLSLSTAQVGPAPPTNLRLSGAEVAPPDCELPPMGGPAHGYFDALIRRPEHYCNWSLRSQAQLNSLVADPVATFFTYSPTTDTHPEKQDAAKFVRTAGGSSSIPGKQQLHMQIKPRITSGSVILTWDWYWGREFRENRGAVNFYKMWQIMMDGHGWWTLMSGLAWASDTDKGEVGKAWDSFRSGTLATGVVQREPWTPGGPGTPDQRNKSGSQYGQRHSVWSRYWVEIKMLQPPAAFTEWSNTYLGGAPVAPNPHDPEGRWHMVSLWMADEVRPAQRLLYRVPINWNADLGWDPWISVFRFEMNTSQAADSLVGPLVGYGRNVVVLRDYELPSVAEKDTFLFQKPTR